MKTESLRSILFDYSKKINDCANRILNVESSCEGLTVLQFRVLMEIFEKGSQTVGGVAETLGLAGANASTLCKKLEKAGFLIRARDLSDERVVRLELTKKGAALVSATEERFVGMLSRIFESEDDASIAMMVKGLEKFLLILNRVQKEEDAAPADHSDIDYAASIEHKEMES